jgi:hypothetical protein
MKYRVWCSQLVVIVVAGLGPGYGLAGSEDSKELDINAPDANVWSPADDQGGEGSSGAGKAIASRFSWWPENLIVAPLPDRTPTFGWGLKLITGVFLDLDKKHPDTPPSMAGLFGFYSENDSYFVGTGGKFNLADDRFRLDTAAAYMDINYRFYGVGNEAGDDGLSVRLTQRSPFYFVTGKYEVFPDGYLGLGYMYSDIETKVGLGDVLPGSPELVFDLKVAGVQVPFQYDTRDDHQYPRNGLLVDAKAMLYRELAGSDVEAESYSVSANSYTSIRNKDVLAIRGKVQATSEGTPFFLLASVGGRGGLRGYEQGRYQDRMMYAVQAEYRWQLSDTWKVVGFAGVGEVAADFGSFFNNFLPAAGVGLRYALSKKFGVNLAVDVAHGKNGTEYYLSVGEAF